ILILIHITRFIHFNDTPTTDIYTLSLHDALPILSVHRLIETLFLRFDVAADLARGEDRQPDRGANREEVPGAERQTRGLGPLPRSEEHTSELQSPCNLVCRLLLEKKNDKKSME